MCCAHMVPATQQTKVNYKKSIGLKTSIQQCVFHCLFSSCFFFSVPHSVSLMATLCSSLDYAITCGIRLGEPALVTMQYTQTAGAYWIVSLLRTDCSLNPLEM